MDKARIEEIIAIAEQHDLDALEVEDSDGAVRVVRRSGGANVIPSSEVGSASAPPDQPAAAREPLPPGATVVPSPVVGVFTPVAEGEASVPVQPGDRITKGQVLGYVEAMKMATQVCAPADGVLSESLVAEGQAVQFGDPLFLIRPAAD